MAKSMTVFAFEGVKVWATENEYHTPIVNISTSHHAAAKEDIQIYAENIPTFLEMVTRVYNEIQGKWPDESGEIEV
jgi:hypothetical protein